MFCPSAQATDRAPWGRMATLEDAKYRVGERFRMRENNRVFVIESVFLGYYGHTYCVRWVGTQYYTNDVAEAFMAPEVAEQLDAPVTLIGRVKGNCECGSWAVAGFENCHSPICPMYRKP